MITKQETPNKQYRQKGKAKLQMVQFITK